MPKKKDYPKGFSHYSPPTSPKKPIPPKEYFEEVHNEQVIARLSDQWSSTEIDIQELIRILQKEEGTLKLKIEHEEGREEHSPYGPDFGSGCDVSASLEFVSIKTIKNPQYDTLLKQYERDTKKYKVKLKKYRAENKEWKALKKRWDAEEAEEEKEYRRQQYEELKKEFE